MCVLGRWLFLVAAACCKRLNTISYRFDEQERNGRVEERERDGKGGTICLATQRDAGVCIGFNVVVYGEREVCEYFVLKYSC